MPCLLAACTVGPNFKHPAVPTVDRYTARPLPYEAGSQRFLAGGAIAARWWTVFKSPMLDALEDQAMNANSDLASARAALRQAHELYLAQRAALWPTVGLAGSGQRAKNSDVIAPPLANNSEEYTLFQGQLNLSYDPDVFGSVRRQIESAAATAEAQRYQSEAVYLTLTTNVANAAIQLASLQSQLDATEDVIAANQRTFDLTRQEQAAGQAAKTDVATARSALEQAEQLAPPLRKQIGQQRDLLAVLIGRPSAEAPAARFSLADFTLPRDLPVSLPADLVRQRPDVLAAEANLHVASAQVGVAVAARLPDFTLTGSAGGASGVLTTLLTPDNTLWSIGGSVAWTVFDAGALKHKQKAAEAALDQAKAQYRSAVLGALQNTADTLQAIVQDAETDRHAWAAQVAADSSLRLAQQEAAKGETGVLPVLTARAAEGQAAVTMAQSHAARYADTVALFQALGGGWWNDPQQAVVAR
ncbi:MAG: efflux transporter outer membrane subunit [Caulobacteraceae bacterium]|nr:efflux transporter outer membrane subunit [Caulobacteraceae bacterium]